MSHPQRPFFSVVIPTYNRLRRVSKSIESVLNQSFKNFEVIVIDDHSSDGTYNFIRNKYESDSRILVLVHTRNKERGAARNTGINAAKGKFILFLDSDDELEPEHLEGFYNIIQNKSGFILYGSKHYFRREDGSTYQNSDMKTLSPGVYNYKLFLRGNPIGCIFCVKKDYAIRNMFNESREYSALEDWLYLIINTNQTPIYIHDICTYVVNDHGTRSMRNDNKLVQKRIATTREIEETLSLTLNQKNILWANTFYFNSVHSLLAGNRALSFYYLKKSVCLGKRNLNVVRQLARIVLH